MIFTKAQLLDDLSLAEQAYLDPPTLPPSFVLVGMIEVDPAVTAKLLADESSVHLPFFKKAFPLDDKPWGFVAINGDTIEVGIRGTETKLEWALDAAAILVNFRDEFYWPSQLKVHEGFQLIFGALSASLTVLFAKAKTKASKWRIRGHSLGLPNCGHGAYVTAVRARNVSVVLFESPRLGNFAFTQYWNAATPLSVSVKNAPDIVPKLPPTGLGFSDPGAPSLRLDGGGSFFELKTAHSLEVGVKPGLGETSSMILYYIAKHEIVLPTGECFDAGVYSGHGAGLNNPALVTIHNVGPIPPGKYLIGTPIQDVETGAFSMSLSPAGHDALGRSGFRFHGDTAEDVANGWELASLGCIVAPRVVREAAWNNGVGDRIMDVAL